MTPLHLWRDEAGRRGKLVEEPFATGLIRG
jgi:hypothetical protein